jgi:phosphohistidine phosphatase
MTERLREGTLVLLRHAKAEAAPGKPDIDRRLSSRGHADAAAAGAWLGTQGHLPELVICSPARRTRQTWHAVAVALSETAPDAPAPTVQYESAVYHSIAADLLTLVRTVPDAISSVLLIGHNPTISQLSVLLDPDAGLDSDGLRTSGIAVHRVPGSWAECGNRPAPLAASHTARD